MNKIRQQLEDMYKEMDALFMIELTKWRSFKVLDYANAYNKSCTSSLVNEGSWVGRDREKYEVLQMLLDANLGGTNNLSVIPIVGIGGIGKTALAQMVYNSVHEVSFQLRMWASVSTDFDVVRITKSILESGLGERCHLSNLDPLQIKLQDLIRGKRFLLVLDNYWSEEYTKWDVLSLPLKVGAKGSKVIVTTRSTIVSQILGTVPSYYLGNLSDDECWKLIKQRASLNNVMENNLQLEEIGRMIAKKCKGVPIAARTLGSMLQFKNSLAGWKSVLESEIWDLPRDQSDVFRALFLSYHHLPAHLRTCFIYCAIFPKNYDFNMNELVLRWIGQGFIHSNGKVLLEDLGNNYFDSLLQRSFFQFSHVNRQGENIYKMHDLIHGMARSISSHACLHQQENQEGEEGIFFKNTRHLSLHCVNAQSITLEGCDWYKSLRTFKATLENVGQIQVDYGMFLKFKSLRELDLSFMGLDDLPVSIGDLKCLRYLNLSGNHFLSIPESITNLFGLLILNLEECDQLFELPNEMKKMINLHYLLVNVKQLNCMPSEFGKLVNLVSLSAFLVGRSAGCSIGELKNMRYLRGSLCIRNLENVLNVNEAKEAMLGMKTFLHSLELEWSDSTPVNNAEEVLAGLRPHENLKELLMTNYSGYLLPSWFSDPLCMISSIHLQRCQKCSILAPLAKLRHLKSLVIESMSNLCDVDSEISGSQSLEHLKIKDMPNLAFWGRSFGFPCLRTLDIIDCPLLINLPMMHTSSLRYLNISGCHELRSLPQYGFPNSLQVLKISDCCIIRDRCRVEEGEDWHKIRSIPRIEIDYMEITWDIRQL